MDPTGSLFEKKKYVQEGKKIQRSKLKSPKSSGGEIKHKAIVDHQRHGKKKSSHNALSKQAGLFYPRTDFCSFLPVYHGSQAAGA